MNKCFYYIVFCGIIIVVKNQYKLHVIIGLKKISKIYGEYKMARVKKIEKVSFWGAIKNYFVGYLNFNGTATRREYWFIWLCSLVLFSLRSLLPFDILWAIVFAITFLPSRTLACRRFHDVGLSCWWYLVPTILINIYTGIMAQRWLSLLALDYIPQDLMWLLIIMLIYAVALFIVYLQPSKLKNNKYRQ